MFAQEQQLLPMCCHPAAPGGWQQARGFFICEVHGRCCADAPCRCLGTNSNSSLHAKPQPAQPAAVITPAQPLSTQFSSSPSPRVLGPLTQQHLHFTFLSGLATYPSTCSCRVPFPYPRCSWTPRTATPPSTRSTPSPASTRSSPAR